MAMLGLLIVLAVTPCMFNGTLVRVLGMNDDRLRKAYNDLYPRGFRRLTQGVAGPHRPSIADALCAAVR